MEVVLTFKLNEKIIRIYRTEKKDVLIDDGDNSLKLPRASGPVTLGLINLINSNSNMEIIDD